MDSRDREKLQRNYSSLLEVMYSAISPHLISKFVLTMEMHAEIESGPTERKKMEKLLCILPTRGGDAMQEFVDALKPSYAWIARQMENDMGNGNNPRMFAGRGNNNDVRNLPEMSIADHVRDITRILQRHSRVLSHWTFLANTMTLMPSTVMDIKREMSFSGGYEYAIMMTLEAWVTQVGNSRATFSKLISLLKRESMNQSAEGVADLWATLVHHDNTNPVRSVRRAHNHPVITDV